jgi:hypothetical protein
MLSASTNASAMAIALSAREKKARSTPNRQIRPNAPASSRDHPRTML